MSAPRFLLVMVAGLLALFAGLNLTAGAVLESWRVDLTERGLYRLSPGTRDVLERLDEPISLDFIYSREEAARYPGGARPDSRGVARRCSAICSAAAAAARARRRWLRPRGGPRGSRPS